MIRIAAAGLKTILLGLALLLPGLICAQKWQNLQTFGGSGNENTGDLYCNSSSECATGFTFQGQAEFQGRKISSQGGSDFVILRRDKNSQNYTYFSHGGGPLDEEIIAVRPLNNGGLLCAGVFWRELVLPDTTLQARDAGKAIFLIAYQANGKVQWTKVIDGSGLKSISDVLLNDNGNIWLSGYFGDSLYVDQQKWAAGGQTDLFLMRLEANGQLLWLQHHGVLGNTRMVGIAELPGRAVVGLGYFDQRVRFGNDLFVANTTDQDLFLAAWGPDGQMLWARKGGGVYDATPVDVVTDDKGRIYFCGNIVGVIRFDNGLSIQSRDGNADLFLGACSPAGTPLWARAYTGDNVQECSRLLWNEQKLYLSGYTLGNFNWGSKDMRPADGFNSFLGILDTLGRPQDVQVLDATGGLYVGGLAYSNSAQLQMAGVYRGQGSLETLSLLASSSFDFFTADFSNLATSIPTVFVNDSRFKVFPTPSRDFVFIQAQEKDTYKATLYDGQGRVVLKTRENPSDLPLETLNPGMYFLQIEQSGLRFLYKVIKP